MLTRKDSSKNKLKGGKLWKIKYFEWIRGSLGGGGDIHKEKEKLIIIYIVIDSSLYCLWALIRC